MTKKKKGEFNWSGIDDNGDGTYTTESRIEKKRLLKSLHSSGYTVRSKQNEDGSWHVTTVGTLSQTRRRPTGTGYRPKTRYLKRIGRYEPIGRKGPNPRMSIRPGMGYHGAGPSPRPIRRGNTINRIGSWMERKREQGMVNKQREQNEKEQWKKTEHELNEKMKAERIKKEREDAARKVQKDEFHAEMIQHKRHEEAERLRNLHEEREKAVIQG